ncbi:MAG: hypothetical protein JST90_01255 [Bacteroidetes bacterium]|nr:hypothetical protein [Bacteroidota bacterium]
MKKILIAMAVMCATTYGYCQTPAQKVVKAERKVDTAEARLERAKEEQRKVSEAYRADVKRQIEVNDHAIDSLKGKMVKPLTSPENDGRKKKIDELGNRNADLRNKIGM